MAEAARKAKAEESASSAATVKRASEPGRATIARAALDGRRSTLLSPKSIQPSLRVSQPSDAAEVEADRVAKAVVSMPDPSPAVSPRGAPAISRKAAPAAKAKGAPAADAKVEAEVRAAASGGTPLPMKTRKLLEPRFRANFAGVRIHTDGNAAKLANKLNARAFAFGNHIFFGGGAYDPNSKAGLELLAHELTHTIQQGESIQRKADTSEARVSERTPRQASRLGLSDALDFFADAANAIPGYRMFTILIGVNPINMSAVEASAANILRAIVEFLPGGNIITRVLDSYGIFDKVGGWIEGQLKSLGISGASIKAALNKFMDSLSWRDIFNLSGVWGRAKAIFTEPIGKIISFAKSLFSEILRMVREAVLRPLAALAEGSPGYPLLKVILGFDPVTGEAVQPTADAVIGGLMTLIGQEELWANIKRANAIPRAWAWFKGAMGGLKALVTSIPSRFMTALKGLEIMDFVVLPSAFIKLAKVFGNFMGDFGSWALGTVLDLLKIIVEVVAPGVMPYIAKAGAAFNKILKDPVSFVKTLVRAAVQGFRQFASNFLTHLKASLIGWLTGALGGAGIYIPQGFSLMEIVKFVLSVMGLTWANIRVKLVKATNETTVKVLETGFDIVKTLVTEGPAAAWQKIVETLTNLKQMAIDAVMDFVKSKVVEAAVTKLLSMLSPAGAVIQAIIAIYNTVMFFVERIKQIAAVAASFIDSIATIASGNIGPAANRVEQTMAGLLTLVISFLARIAGLGKVSDAVIGLVNKIRAPIDKALDKVVAWIVETAKKLGKMVVSGAKKVLNWFREKRRMQLGDGGTHTLAFKGNEKNARLTLASVEKPVEEHLQDAINDPGLKKGPKDRARGALAFYSANLAPLSGKPVPNPAPPALQALLDKLPDSLNQFAELLRAISADTDVPIPAAVPAFGGPARAAVDRLSNRSSRGGADASSGQSNGWAVLQSQGLTSGSVVWVRMHMISAAYGGIDDATNLISAPSSLNTGGIVRGFEQRVETTLYGADKAKDVRGATRSADRALFRRLDKLKAVIWLETTSSGYWPAQNDPLGKPVCDAKTFVRSVTFKGGLHFPRDNDWGKDPAALVTTSVGIPAPDFSKTFRPNINEIGETLMAKTCGVALRGAREIIADRGGTPAPNPHTGVGDLRTRLRAARKAAGKEMTPELDAAISAISAAAAAKKIKWK